MTMPINIPLTWGLGFLNILASMQPLTILRDGFCPSGYSSQGNYCVPGQAATFAIPKVGFCPSGYVPQGNYCLANPGAKPAILKSGFCPTGFSPQGN